MNERVLVRPWIRISLGVVLVLIIVAILGELTIEVLDGRVPLVKNLGVSFFICLVSWPFLLMTFNPGLLFRLIDNGVIFSEKFRILRIAGGISILWIFGIDILRKGFFLEGTYIPNLFGIIFTIVGALMIIQELLNLKKLDLTKDEMEALAAEFDVSVDLIEDIRSNRHSTIFTKLKRINGGNVHKARCQFSEIQQKTVLLINSKKEAG